jgi:hypothetical protein
MWKCASRNLALLYVTLCLLRQALHDREWAKRHESAGKFGCSAACDLCILISKLLLGSSEVLRVETSISLSTCFDGALRNVEEAKRPLKNRPLWVANPSPFGNFHPQTPRRFIPAHKETSSEPV